MSLYGFFSALLSWSDRLTNQEIIGILKHYCLKIEEKLTAYHSDSTSKNISYGRTKRERFLWEAILENGRLTYEAELHWAKKTINELSTFE